jgi:hypothetical protein
MRRSPGATVPFACLLAQSPSAAVTVSELQAYPTGFSFRLTVVFAGEPDGMRRSLDLELPDEWRAGVEVGELPDELFRFGLRWSDGGLVLDRLSRVWRAALREDRPALLRESWGMGGNSFDCHWWVPAVPPAGELAFLCAWPVHNIPLSEKTLDASLIGAAGARSRALSQDDPVPTGGSPPEGFFVPETRKSHRRSGRGYLPSRPQRERHDSWPKRWLPTPVEMDRVLARTDRAALVARAFAAHPFGYRFVVSVRLQSAGEEHHPALRFLAYPGAARPVSWGRVVAKGRLPDGMLAIGLMHADGRFAYADRWNPLLRHPDDDEAAAMVSDGGYGDPSAFEIPFEVFPLPPAGPLRLIFQWPEMGIEATSLELDARPLIAAAQDAVQTWPPPGSDDIEMNSQPDW